ncbi:MFS transporter (plasmid) [Arthrobacter sp. D3-18]
MQAPLIFHALLLCVGASTLLLQTLANSTVQIAAPGSMLGRIMGIYELVWFGGAAIGGPFSAMLLSISVPPPACCSPVPYLPSPR